MLETTKPNTTTSNQQHVPPINLLMIPRIVSRKHHLIQLMPNHHPVPEFLYQLTRMLSDDNSEVIEWENGRIFVHSPPKLASDILSKYFRHSNFSSFQRQLNYFGFRKVSGKHKMAPCCYIHDATTSDINSLFSIKRHKSGGGKSSSIQKPPSAISSSDSHHDHKVHKKSRQQKDMTKRQMNRQARKVSSGSLSSSDDVSKQDSSTSSPSSKTRSVTSSNSSASFCDDDENYAPLTKINLQKATDLLDSKNTIVSNSDSSVLTSNTSSLNHNEQQNSGLDLFEAFRHRIDQESVAEVSNDDLLDSAISCKSLEDENFSPLLGMITTPLGLSCSSMDITINTALRVIDNGDIFNPSTSLCDPSLDDIQEGLTSKCFHDAFDIAASSTSLKKENDVDDNFDPVKFCDKLNEMIRAGSSFPS